MFEKYLICTVKRRQGSVKRRQVRKSLQIHVTAVILMILQAHVNMHAGDIYSGMAHIDHREETVQGTLDQYFGECYNAC